jgi:hypothetical protein
MNFAFWADATAALHFTIIISVIVGLFISFRYKRFRPWETAAVLLIIVFWSLYGNCPLTLIEQHLRTLAGQNVNLSDVPFLSYYSNKVFGVSIASSLIQRTTYFTGGSILTASIEWFRPYLHFHVFSIRRSLRRMVGLRAKPKRRYA